MIITIDGPSASGKSTIARLLSLKLNYFYLCSGYLYRGFAYNLSINKINIKKEEDVVAFSRHFFFNYFLDEESNPFLVINDQKVTSKELMKEDISYVASIISGYKEVRLVISEWQRRLVKNKNSIIDGRDCGTVIFKDADIKFFLTASVDVRAKRMCDRNKNLHLDEESFNICKKQLEERDNRDKNRTHSPLYKAQDAILIDSSEWTVEKTVDVIYKKIIDYLNYFK